MLEGQIKQNAKKYASSPLSYSGTTYSDVYAAYLAGAHSRDEEIEELKRLLNNALEMLKDTYEDGDYFCERLLDIPEEEKICAVNCDKEGVLCDCILRYLKHYKKYI